ncbi:hypothetical protein JW905_15075, partial [bacterium]|nr:hypothetical protein [candidate division CSSED10-310 bacterium]
MSFPLKRKLILRSILVVVVTGLVTTWTGVHFIGGGIVGEVQRRVEMDLNVATEVFNREVNNIRIVVRLMAEHPFTLQLLESWSGESAAELADVMHKEGLDFLSLASSD